MRSAILGGMDPQEAIDSPRVFYEGGTLWCEDSVPDAVASTANFLRKAGKKKFNPGTAAATPRARAAANRSS